MVDKVSEDVDRDRRLLESKDEIEEKSQSRSENRHDKTETLTECHVTLYCVKNLRGDGWEHQVEICTVEKEKNEFSLESDIKEVEAIPVASSGIFKFSSNSEYAPCVEFLRFPIARSSFTKREGLHFTLISRNTSTNSKPIYTALGCLPLKDLRKNLEYRLELTPGDDKPILYTSVELIRTRLEDKLLYKKRPNTKRIELRISKITGAGLNKYYIHTTLEGSSQQSRVKEEKIEDNDYFKFYDWRSINPSTAFTKQSKTFPISLHSIDGSNLPMAFDISEDSEICDKDHLPIKFVLFQGENINEGRIVSNIDFSLPCQVSNQSESMRSTHTLQFLGENETENVKVKFEATLLNGDNLLDEMISNTPTAAPEKKHDSELILEKESKSDITNETLEEKTEPEEMFGDLESIMKRDKRATMNDLEQDVHIQPRRRKTEQIGQRLQFESESKEDREKEIVANNRKIEFDMKKELEEKQSEMKKEFEEKESEMNKLINSLTNDNQNKQNLINRLLDEVDKRSDAIRNCGSEIVNLRKENKMLLKEKQNLANRLALREREIEVEVESLGRISNNQDFNENMSVNELGRRMSNLTTKYNAERGRNLELMKRLDILQEKSKQKRVQRQKIKKLEIAHQAQAKYIQNLQEDLQKLEIYKSTISTQEKVIAKLENLMEAKLRSNNNRNGTTESAKHLQEEVERLTRQNAELQRKFMAGEHIDHGMKNQIEELEKGIAESKNSDDTRVAALEAQLVENARSFAKEIADLKMKLMEYEAMDSDNDGSASDNFSDDDDF